MIIRRLILVFFLVILLTVVAVLGYLHFANLNQYRDQIAGEISTLLGRTVVLGDVDINLWPVISVTTNNITVANASWGSQPHMAEIGHLSASVRPLSLLFGPVLVQDFTLNDVSILVESDQTGKYNWDLATSPGDVNKEIADEEESQLSELPLMLETVRLSNINVIKHLNGTPDQQYHLDNLVIQPNSSDQLDLVVTGKLLDIPLALQGKIGTLSELRTGEGEFTLSGTLGSLALKMTGRLAILSNKEETQITLLASSDNVADVIKAAGLSVLLSGPLNIKAEITLASGNQDIKVEGNLGEFNAVATVNLRQGQATIDSHLKRIDTLGTMLGIAALPREEVVIKGKLGLLDHAIKLQDITVVTGKSQAAISGTLALDEGNTLLDVKANGDSLADLKTDLPPLAFNGTAGLVLSQREVKVDPLQLRVGVSDIKGSIQVVTAKPGAVKADIVATTLDLTEFSHNEKENEVKKQDTAQVTTTPATPSKTESAESKYIFTDEPLPLDLLQNSGLDVTLKADKLVSPVITLNDLRGTGSLHNGELTADVYFKTPGGGRSTIDIVINSSGKQSTLHAKLEGRDLRLKVISGDLSSSKDSPTINISADLKSAGHSPRALAANSNGNVLVEVGPGELNNTILNRMAGDIIAKLISTLNPFTKAEDKSHLECGVMNADIVDGMSKVDTLMIQDKKVQIVAGGTLDLKTEKINFEFNTKPRTGVGISADMFVTPFVGLGGTLKNPSIELKKTGTLLTLGAAFFTGGLSLALEGGVDRVSGSVDQCAVILPKYPLPPLEDE